MQKIIKQTIKKSKEYEKTNIKKARSYAKKAYSLSNDIHDSYLLGRSSYQLAKTYYSNEKYYKAFIYNNIAKDYFKSEEKLKPLSNCLYLEANIYNCLSFYQEACKSYHKCYLLSKDKNLGIIALLNIIPFFGDNLKKSYLKELKKACKHNQCKEIYLYQKAKLIINTDKKKAKSILKEAKNICKDKKAKKPLIEIYHLLALCYTKDNDKAITYINKAIDIASILKDNNSISKLMISLYQIENRVKHLKKALIFSNAPKEKIQIYNMLIEYYKNNKKHEKAYMVINKLNKYNIHLAKEKTKIKMETKKDFIKQNANKIFLSKDLFFEICSRSLDNSDSHAISLCTFDKEITFSDFKKALKNNNKISNLNFAPYKKNTYACLFHQNDLEFLKNFANELIKLTKNSSKCYIAIDMHPESKKSFKELEASLSSLVEKEQSAYLITNRQ